MSTATPDAGGLRREAVGLREVLFQSITAMAPGAAIAASIPAGAAFAGGSLPLSVVIAMVACLFTAFCIAELARHLPAAGSVGTYVSRGLHPSLGFLVAWMYVFVQALVPTLLLLQLAFTATPTLHTEWHSWPADLWWPFVVAGALVIAAAGYRGVTTSARLGTVLGAFEILVFLVLAAMFIVHVGRHNTLSVFGTGHTPAAHKGISGVFAGSVYTVLAFAGFEAAAPLAEEARDPGRTVRRAVLGAALGIGVLYVVTTYAVANVVGPGQFDQFGSSDALSWQGLAKSLYGLFWVVVFFAIVNSTIANANAGLNVSTRTAYAMARVGVLPRPLARLHPKYRSPVVAVALQFLIAVGATIALGEKWDPTTAFNLVATGIVIVVICVYMLANLACIGYFLRVRRGDFNIVSHLLVPLIGIAVFVPALLTAAGLPVFSFIAKLPPPVSYGGPAVGAWLVLGFVVLGYLWSRHRQRVLDIGNVFVEGGDDAAAAPEAGGDATGSQDADTAAAAAVSEGDGS